jgi:hypothetical protein
MQVTFTANSARELHEQIVSFSKEFGISAEGSRQQTLNLVSGNSLVAGAPPANAPADDKPARTRRTKAQIEADEAAAAAKAAASPASTVAANTDFTSEATPAAPAAAASPSAPANAAPAAAVVQPTIVATPQQKQQVTDALTNINGKFGLPIARGVLMKFGTDRLSSLAPEKYADFLKLCEEAKLCATAADVQKLLA